MKFKHRVIMFFGGGPRFILAAAGTDPLTEPELYKTRRGGGVGCWVYALGLCILASSAYYAWVWYAAPR